MNLFAGVAFAILVPLLALAIGVAVWASQRGRVGIAVAVVVVVVSGLATAAAIFASQSDERRTAVILVKSETVTQTRLVLIPPVVHQFRAQARLTGVPASDPGATLSFDLWEQDFDRLHVGDVVTLCVTKGPFRVARLDGARSLIPPQRLVGLLGFGARGFSLAALVAFVVLLLRRGRGLILALVLTLVAAGLDAFALEGLWRARPTRGIADVVAIRHLQVVRLSSIYGKRQTDFTLPMPYDEIELHLAPRAGADPVRVIDRFDAGQRVLHPGDRVAVAYAPDVPRLARITNLRRSYGWRNLSVWWAEELAVVLAPLTTFAAFTWLVTRKRRPRQTHSSKPSP